MASKNQDNNPGGIEHVTVTEVQDRIKEFTKEKEERMARGEL
jgi:hypothetical protein